MSLKLADTAYPQIDVSPEILVSYPRYFLPFISVSSVPLRLIIKPELGSLNYSEERKQLGKTLLTSCTSSGNFITMNERLEQLIEEAQRHAPQTEGRQLALIQLVDEILRSRKVGRSPIGQPLTGVYREIYDRAKQQLLNDIDRELSNYNPKNTSVRVWVNTMKERVFKTILDDVLLKNLAVEAQQYPPNTELRQHSLRELVEAIRLSGKLARPHQTQVSRQFYDLIYEEAVNKTLTYICRKIENYDPERGDKKFMNWVNFRLDRVILECFQEFRNPNITNLPSLNELEDIVQPEETPSLLERVRETLEEDPKKVFKQTYIRNRPDASFQVIALARFSGKSWEEISQNLEIPLPTLSSFFQRCCEKFRSYFEDII